MSTLKDILKKQVLAYQEKNSDEASLWEKCSNLLFHGMGETGRERAKKYLSIIENAESDKALLEQLSHDFYAEDGLLKDSYELRNDLFQGVCEYKGILPTTLNLMIDAATNKKLGTHHPVEARIEARIEIERQIINGYQEGNTVEMQVIPQKKN